MKEKRKCIRNINMKALTLDKSLDPLAKTMVKKFKRRTITVHFDLEHK